MAGKSGQRCRVLALLELFKSKTDEMHPLSTTELIQQLALGGIVCDRKTIYADIEALNNFGYEILSTHQPKAGYFLTTRDFELPEVSLLTDAVLSAAFITPKKTNQLLGKLKELLNVYQAKAYAGRSFLENRNKCDNEEIYYSIDVLERAIQQNKKVKLQYYRHHLQENHFIGSRSKEMLISPYALVWADDHYYLICNYEKYDNLMHLRLDRMKAVTMTEEPFRHFSAVSEYKEVFNVADYTDKTFHMFSGVRQEVVLRCSTAVLEQVIDRFGDKIFIRQSDGAHFVFSCDAYVSEGLIGWLLPFGQDVEVLCPEGLRHRLAQVAESISAMYR